MTACSIRRLYAAAMIASFGIVGLPSAPAAGEQQKADVRITSAKAIRCEKLRSGVPLSERQDVFKLFRLPKEYSFLVVHVEFDVVPDEPGGDVDVAIPIDSIRLVLPDGERAAPLATCSPLGQFSDFGLGRTKLELKGNSPDGYAHDPVFVVPADLTKAKLVLGGATRDLTFEAAPIVEIDPSRGLTIEVAEARRIDRATTKLTARMGSDQVANSHLEDLSSEDGQLLRATVRIASTLRGEANEKNGHQPTCSIQGAEILLADAAGNYSPPIAVVTEDGWYSWAPEVPMPRSGERYESADVTFLYRVSTEKKDLRILLRGHVVGALPAEKQN